MSSSRSCTVTSAALELHANLISSAQQLVAAAVIFVFHCLPHRSCASQRQLHTLTNYRRCRRRHLTVSCLTTSHCLAQALHLIKLSAETQPKFDTMQQEEPSTSGHSPECFVIVHNVAKKHNIGTLARSCTAFNVVQARLLQQDSCWLSTSWTFSRSTDVLGGIKALQHLRKSRLSCSCSPCILCYLG